MNAQVSILGIERGKNMNICKDAHSLIISIGVLRLWVFIYSPIEYLPDFTWNRVDGNGHNFQLGYVHIIWS